MFKYTKKILTAASLLVFCSGQLYAMKSARTDDEDRNLKRASIVTTTGTQEPTFLEDMPVEIRSMILVEASKAGADPRVLELVCSYWYNSMHLSIPATKYVRYTTQKKNYFMEDCMRLYREGLVYRATLFYKQGQEGEVAIRFSDFKDGIADLSGCGAEADRQVYTTSRERFFEVGGANENRLFTLIAPSHLVEDLLPVGPRAAVHIVFLWRWEYYKQQYEMNPVLHEKRLLLDYATSSIEEVSSRSVFKNWLWAKYEGNRATYEENLPLLCTGGWQDVFHVVCKPKLEL